MRIVFCGVGALGSHAVLLSRHLVSQGASFTVVDHDRVETANLGGQFYTKQTVGRYKAEALKLQLFNFFGASIDARPVRVDPHNVVELCAGAGLIVDAFDNAASRRVLSAHAHTTATPCVHAGISGDGLFGMVRWDERFTPDEEDGPGQATCEGALHLPMIATIGANLAQVITEFVTTGARRDVLISPGSSSSFR